MNTALQFWPDSASSISGEVDLFFVLMVVVCATVATGIAFFLIYSAIRYHRERSDEMGRPTRYVIPAEVAWTVIPFFAFMGMFAWGSKLYFDIERPPDDAIRLYAVGQQWMWKLQHPEGPREINELHIPVGRPVRLTMISQDVIHSFFVPAFRTKQDVLPERYTTTWFEATKPGKYHLFCAEYCGTKHSGMIGWIYAMAPQDYQRWLARGAAEGSLASQGEKYFHQFGCANCHHFDRQGRAPYLKDLYGRQVEIASGQTVLADETYIRESILDPNAKIVYGFQPNIMPNFTGQLDEQQVLALVSYIKALGPQPEHSNLRVRERLRKSTGRRKESRDRERLRSPVRNHGSAEMIEQFVERPPQKTYLNQEQGILSWLLTTDHKRIGILYTISITFLFFLGGFFALLMRLELIEPRNWLVTAETYNKLFTMHGIIMVWFFLIPSIPNTIGNFVLPMAIGAKDLAFPKINLASWYVFMLGSAVTVYALFRGGVDSGWTFYTPFSTTYSTTYITAAAIGIFINGFSSIMTGLNFIVTVHRMRAPGLTWYKLPIFVWSTYATSIIFVLATPVLATTLLMVAVERIFQVGIFDPALGGDPVLFQHMFWFYSHPAVYIMVLPAMAVVSEIIPAFARKPLFGYKAVAWSSIAIATLGFLVWGHHMFVAGISVYSAMSFSILSYFVAIPSAIKVFNWTATIYRGAVSWDTPMLYAIGFVGLFTIGGMTGLFLAALGLDVHVTDTYFVIAHFHYIMVGGTVMAFLGGVHYWWPKISGKLYPEGLAKISALTVFLGFNLTFFPQFVLGYLGMPRRYAAYPEEFQFLNILSTAGASILGVGYVLPLLYLLWSWKYGKEAGPNPWRATGLEWQTSSPPPKHNFEHPPVVTTSLPYPYEEMKEELGLVQTR